MSSPYATTIKGGPPYIGKYPYKFQCPSGTYITKFNGRSGAQLDRIGIECSDGSTILSDGGNEGDAFQIDSGGKGFQSIMNTGFNGGSKYQSFNGHGYAGDNGQWNADVYQYRCPLNQYMNSIDGTIESSLVKTLNVSCDNIPEQCANNVESPYCKWMMPQLKLSASAKDKSKYHNILNQACQINMTDTCRNNQTDLDVSTVQNWCKLNPNDEFCSCFNAPPDYIMRKAPEVAGLPQCWNNTCSVKGFKPQTLQTCPSITICSQDITTEGNNNLSSNVVIRQDCKPTTVISNGGATISPTPTTTPTPSSPITSSTSTPISNPTSSLSLSSYMLYFLLFIILVVVIIMFWEDDDEPVQKLKNYRK